MDWFNFFRLLIVALYLLGTILLTWGTLRRNQQMTRIGTGIAIAGFVLHTLELGHFITNYSFKVQTDAFYIRLLSWSMLAIFFFLWWRLKLAFLALSTSPLALLLFVAAMRMPKKSMLIDTSFSGLFFWLHICSLYLSLSLLTVAFGAGIVFIYLNRKIKSKEKLLGFQKDLPALSTFDRVNHLAAVIGFPLFTLGILSGFIWAGSTWGKTVSWDPKEIVSIFVWIVYCFWFTQRLLHGWRGRKPALLAICVFCFTIVSLLGVNFLLPTHHSFKP